MDLVTSIPVRIYDGTSIPSFLEDVQDRIAQRAHQLYQERGCVPGHELDDWLEAERELIIKPTPTISVGGEDLIAEVTLPEIDLPHVAVRIGPRQFVISSDVDADGLQVCQVIDLPAEVSMDGVDAEQIGNTIRITTALAR